MTTDSIATAQALIHQGGDERHNAVVNLVSEIERLQKDNVCLRGYLEKIAGIVINEIPVSLIQNVPLGDRYPITRSVAQSELLSKRAER